MFLANFSGDASRPSFFEMIAQQEMMPTLRPAMKYAFNILGSSYRSMQWTSRFSDELFYLGLFLLEKHHLNHYDASFSENFYGLKRVETKEISGKNNYKVTKLSPMNDGHRYRALFFLVVVPYVKHKMDELYKELVPVYSISIVDNDNLNPNNQEEPNSFRTRLKNKFKKIFVSIYPAVNASFEGAIFLYQLLYLYEKISFFTPFLNIQRLTLRRLSLQEMQAQDKTKRERRKKRLQNLYGGPLVQLWKLIVLVYDSGLDYSKKLLPISIFAFRFLEWWYSSSNTFGQTVLPIPPPADPPKVMNNDIKIPSDKSICAICNGIRTNTALASSGHVFCYPCIFSYVNQYHKCPITYIQMEVDQIRKLYETT